MRKYRASGQAPVSGVLQLLIVAIISGVVVGGILWAVDNYLHLYLVVLFPLLAAAIVGGILTLVVRSSKIRNPLVAGLCALIGGLLIFSTYHFASYYISFRDVVRTALVESGAKTLSDNDLDELIDQQLQIEVGDTGFIGYMKLMNQEGITISRTVSTSSESGFTLNDTVLWVYWGAELLLVAIGVAIAAGRAAGEPFDESSGAWYGGLQFVGVTIPKSRKDLVNALKNGDVQGAGRLLTRQPFKYPRVEVYARRGQDSMGDVYLQVNIAQRQNRSTIAQRGMVSASEFERLQRAMNEAAATA
jgi:hypothetical protein